MIFASFEFLFLFLPIFFVGLLPDAEPAAELADPDHVVGVLRVVARRLPGLAGLRDAVHLPDLPHDGRAPGWAAGRASGGCGRGWPAISACWPTSNTQISASNAFNGILAIGDSDPVAWAEIVLPAGLSFYVLQSISYLVDVWRGTIPVSRSLLNYAAYKAMFSQLIAGPIVRYAQIADELKGRVHSLALFGLGARRFAVGFCMKVIVADTLSPLVDAIFKLPAPTLADSWLGAASYTLQLYFDFAGYSAMAIGLALMIGFHFPENFDFPYLAGSIQGFWQRWHMTLSSFLRDYLYVPLGGNRRGEARTYVNLVLTMLIGGLWHGANWTFVAWGAWHGGMLALHRLYRARGGAMPWLAGHALTLLAVAVGWVVFRADTFGEAARIYAGMAGLHGARVSDDLAWQLTPDRLWMVFIGIAVVYAPLLARPAAAGTGRVGASLTLAGPFCGFALAVVLLYSRAAVPFLYFQF